ncbi:DNA polymerase III alpha subunit [Thioalkalivibrio nitratireducens DSM 14787]|uniref:DNA polymerase III subunit alpha n=1 Tax=Thioalkalivibrio nitratireducens (strain DSM 14787 / UNIQEM 213 / ALEN2) TaxID=1255043 RepID=L0DVC2_THIND|nr:DNA polymerase III subunit alpha [Thioalkalivibrio nitratireducens]AGA33554.1 DNA polymerase III alpha subunit [Thioalkalivibrio nitratireducens DSM 14787]
MNGFVHLRVHSEYSLVDGLVRLKPLVQAVAGAGMPAVAVTDHCNLFGLVKFYRAALVAGVQPIVGADVLLRDARSDGSLARLTLLAQNDVGYRHLTRLISRAWQEGQERGVPRLDCAWLEGASDGLIALSGTIDGLFVQGSGAPVRLSGEVLAPWLALFPDRFYLELTRSGRPGEEAWIAAALDAAEAFGVPVVATNDVRFLASEDFEAHEARVCIHDGVVLADPRRPRRYSEQQYLRTPEEMAELFSDIPEALANAVAIARRCSVRLTLGESVLPDFPVPEGRSVDEHLRLTAAEGLDARLERHCFAPRSDYTQRLERELDVICQMGFPGYFLIVADFIRWARNNRIPVGPGRGSGAGSLVAYALGITDLDPLRYELLFERFLNPERVSMPDFDIDFCMDRRDRVIDYVAERYGRDRVSQIITHGTMAAKAVVRDCGRVLGHGYGFVDRIAKLIPFELGMTLTRALQESEELKALYDEDEEVRGILDLALKLEGLTRNAGKHAGGVVIAPSALTDFSPLYCEEGGGSLVTHFDKDDVEAVGLVKFDFLGLRTLTIIDWTLESIRQMPGQQPVDLDLIPLDDPAAFQLLQAYQTTAVFQLESGGMKDLIRRLQPDTFEDIIALVALYRPGPLQSGMVDDFIDRKHGRAQVEYPHPDLEPILKPTYGVILYQEQVMQIAQVLASYTLGGADLLRRAMGKKKPEEMAKQREIFLKGALARGVAEATATYIFDLMEKFAGYGFNKSHSAAYALLAYQTAWLKAHYPAPFMAAVLSADMDNTDKVVGLIEECRSLGLRVEPPDVNRSAYRFSVRDAGTVVYGLGAIKGVGESAIDTLLKARGDDGAFHSLVDLCQRVDLGKLNKRVLETLIRAGAMDRIGANRATLLAAMPLAVAAAEQAGRNAELGVVDLFGEPASAVLPEFETLPELDDDERLRGEKDTLGLYLTGHPVARYREELRRLTGTTLQELETRLESRPDRNAYRGRQDTARIAGLVVGVRLRNSQNGRMAVVTLDDQTGRAELALFGEHYREHQSRLVPDSLIVAEGTVMLDDYAGGIRMRAQRVLTLDEARAEWARVLDLSLAAVRPEHIHSLHRALTEHDPGSCRLRMRYRCGDTCAELRLPEELQIRPDEQLLRRLHEILGTQSRVALIYGNA